MRSRRTQAAPGTSSSRARLLGRRMSTGHRARRRTTLGITARDTADTEHDQPTDAPRY
jgi:hypothetical protein